MRQIDGAGLRDPFDDLHDLTAVAFCAASMLLALRTWAAVILPGFNALLEFAVQLRSTDAVKCSGVKFADLAKKLCRFTGW